MKRRRVAQADERCYAGNECQLPPQRVLVRWGRRTANVRLWRVRDEFIMCRSEAGLYSDACDAYRAATASAGGLGRDVSSRSGERRCHAVQRRVVDARAARPGHLRSAGSVDRGSRARFRFSPDSFQANGECAVERRLHDQSCGLAALTGSALLLPVAAYFGRQSDRNVQDGSGIRSFGERPIYVDG
jgi:hypothetical protein